MAKISALEIRWFCALTEVKTGFFLAPKNSEDNTVLVAIWGNNCSLW
jgi:hypothetical protein